MADLIQCPKCGESILRQARACRHCGGDLGAARERPRERTGGAAAGRPGRDGSHAIQARAGHQAESDATTSLVLALLSLLVCGLLSPFAIMKGNAAARAARMARQPVPATATAGIVIGWVVLAMLLLGILGYVLLIGG